jgi:hypothetical protein
MGSLCCCSFPSHFNFRQDNSTAHKISKQVPSEEPDIVNSDQVDLSNAPLLDQPSPKLVTISASSSTSPVDQDTIRSLLADVSD